jgi:hypothetical protein
MNTFFHVIYYALYILIMQAHPDSGCRSRLWSCMPTLVAHHDSSRISRLRSHFPTSVTHHDSDHTSRLRSHVSTLVIHPNSDRCHDSGRTSRLQSHITTPVIGRTACLTSLSDGRLHLIELDDCNILQRDHLVGNKPSQNAWPIQYSKTQYLMTSHVQESGLCAMRPMNT